MSDERDWGAEAEREAEIRLPWSHSHRPLPRRVVRPLADFLQTEISSGILLLAAATVALVWANSPWWETYVRFWHVTFTVRLGNLVIAQDLQHWINDALMTFFFLVVGLEIKRELTTGELRDPKRAVLPAIAALGGMVLPALIYLSLNAGGEGAVGWGIPIATDIAFALGVLTLAARGAPPGLKLFLLTLAIVDDIGAIVIITLFYSEGVAALPLLAAVGIVVAIVLLQRIHVRATAVYAVLGAGLWLALFESGIEAAIAGVVLALLTPAVPFQRPKAVSEEARRVADETVDDPRPPDADAASWLYLNRLTREAVSPIGRIEPGLHHFTSLIVIPLFALANAGVRVTGGLLSSVAREPVALGIVLGLVLAKVVGKLVGVSVATVGAERLGLGRLPPGARGRDVLGLGAVAGIGFTVSLFIADLAFSKGMLLDAAKVGILLASVTAGVLGTVIFRLPRRGRRAAAP